MNFDSEKRLAAYAAVEEVQDGMVVGLGTGSTVGFAIEVLANRGRRGLKIQAVATSIRTESIARRSGIAMLDFSTLATIDLCIDGVDEIDPTFRAIKGAGGAMLREKIVAQSAARMIAIADHSKAVTQIGRAPIPVEFLPFAEEFIKRGISGIGGIAVLRITATGQPFLTDQENPIFDCTFESISSPEDLAASLSNIPGVLAHGLFLDKIDAIYIGNGTKAEYRDAISGRR
ncbi:ribose-5-phosphate isomerase RpiA [soil metagenome]